MCDEHVLFDVEEAERRRETGLDRDHHACLEDGRVVLADVGWFGDVVPDPVADPARQVRGVGKDREADRVEALVARGRDLGDGDARCDEPNARRRRFPHQALRLGLLGRRPADDAGPAEVRPEPVDRTAAVEPDHVAELDRPTEGTPVASS